MREKEDSDIVLYTRVLFLVCSVYHELLLYKANRATYILANKTEKTLDPGDLQRVESLVLVNLFVGVFLAHHFLLCLRVSPS